MSDNEATAGAGGSAGEERNRSRSPESDRDSGKRSKRSSSRDRRRRSRSRSKDRSRRSGSRDRRDRDRRDRGRDRDRSRRSGSGSRRRSRSPEDEAVKLRKEQEADREANKDEYTVFVAQIHPKVDERDLFEFFSHVGRVEDIRLIRDQRTQKSKGLCYVEFFQKESVSKAVTLTGQLLGGYPITISMIQQAKPAAANSAAGIAMRLYVGNLHENVTDVDLKPVFEAFGEVDFIDLHRDANGVSKGFGFVQYKSEADARAAMEALNGLEIAGRAIKVGEVDKKNDDSNAMTEIDESGTGGMALNAASRAALMEKLGRGANMSFPSAPVAPAPGMMGPSTAAHTLNVPLQPSTCIVVKNMFDPKTETEPDFDLDIKEDVEEEASKFGQLKHIFVDKNSMGHVYLRYKDISGAKQLQQTFHGRWFAGRQISAEFVVDTIYLNKFPQAK